MYVSNACENSVVLVIKTLEYSKQTGKSCKIASIIHLFVDISSSSSSRCISLGRVQKKQGYKCVFKIEREGGIITEHRVKLKPPETQREGQKFISYHRQCQKACSTLYLPADRLETNLLGPLYRQDGTMIT